MFGRTLKRTVKWIPDRQEAFLSDVQGRDHVSIAEMALDKDSRFVGCRITTYAALGAYLNHFSVFIPTLALPVLATVPLIPLLATSAADANKLTAAGAKHLEREVSSFERMLEGITHVLAPGEL